MIIDQLPFLGGDVQATDEFPIERGTTTYKTTQAALIKPATDAAAAAQAAADEANAKGLPAGGTAGQVLTKTGAADYATGWQDPSGGDALYLTGVAISATTGDIATVSNNAISADHVVVSCVFAAPASIPTAVTWTTAAGSLTLNGKCTTATTADIVLVKKSN